MLSRLASAVPLQNRLRCCNRYFGPLLAFCGWTPSPRRQPDAQRHSCTRISSGSHIVGGPWHSAPVPAVENPTRPRSPCMYAPSGHAPSGQVAGSPTLSVTSSTGSCASVGPAGRAQLGVPVGGRAGDLPFQGCAAHVCSRWHHGRISCDCMKKGPLSKPCSLVCLPGRSQLHRPQAP